jgi:hypothetical protein
MVLVQYLAQLPQQAEVAQEADCRLLAAEVLVEALTVNLELVVQEQLIRVLVVVQAWAKVLVMNLLAVEVAQAQLVLVELTMSEALAVTE